MNGERGNRAGTEGTEATERTGSRGAKKSSFVQLISAVMWSFFGVRKRRDLEADAAQLNPLHLIIAGLLGAVLFVVVLLVIVHMVVG
jgi:amino acid transporter